MGASRRSFLALLGLAPIAAQLGLNEGAAVPETPPLINPGAPFLGDGVMYNGCLIRHREEILREYVRDNLFTPYLEPTRIIKI